MSDLILETSTFEVKAGPALRLTSIANFRIITHFTPCVTVSGIREANSRNRQPTGLTPLRKVSNYSKFADARNALVANYRNARLTWCNQYNLTIDLYIYKKFPFVE